MKLPRCILFLTLALCLGSLTAQNNIQTAYAKADALNDRQEYLKAAKAFQQVQDMALSAGNIDLFMNSATAAGECFYKLNLIVQLENELNKAKKTYARYKSKVSDSMRLEWAEAISKLEGSHQYCLFDANLTDPSAAENAYKHGLAILDTLKRLEGSYVDYEEMEAILRRELLNLYYRMEDYPKALKEANHVCYYYGDMGFRDKIISSSDNRFNSRYVDAFLSKAMVLARLKRFEEAEETLSWLPKSSDKEPSVLRTKGKILMMHSDVDGIDRRREAKNFYDQYIQMQKQRLKVQMDEMNDAQREQYWLSFHDFLFDCYRLEDYASEMLYDLALFSKGYLLEYQNKKAKTYTWKDIQRCLDAPSCAIEFVQYNGKDDRHQLGALVVTPRCTRPAFVHIADLDSLRELGFGGSALKDAVSMQAGNQQEKNGLYTDPELPKRIWTKELLSAMDGASNIYFSADGILHQLAIEYMTPDTALRCHRLTSTRTLVGGHKPLDTRKMLLFGGINYGFPVSSSEKDNDEQAYIFLRSKNVSITDLPGAKREIDSIAALRHSEEDLILSGDNATDSAFRATAPHYPIVLVSTHGFFLGQMSDGTDLRPSVSDNSLSESGLAFAGCRYSLKDSTYEIFRPDGILSAKELSTLTLDSTELIVLSACQTGLGTITADGVYGVQRALKQAGVRAMIVSLWPVDDEATSILMRNFFRNLKNAGKDPDVYEAFMAARKQLISHEFSVFDAGSLSTKKKAKHAAPRFSNAFILIDVL